MIALLILAKIREFTSPVYLGALPTETIVQVKEACREVIRNADAVLTARKEKFDRATR